MKKIKTPDQYIVSFLDIEGYSVAATADDPGEAERLFDAVSKMVDDAMKSTGTLVKKARRKYGKRRSVVARTLGYRGFSDNIAVFCGLYSDPKSEWEHMENAVAIGTVLMIQAKIQSDVLEKGYLSKGGVTIGKYRVEKEFVFGEALVRAYKLQNVTKCPMMRVDPDIRRMIIDSTKAVGKYRSDVEAVKGVFIEGFEGEIYVHYLYARARLEKILYGKEVVPNYEAILDDHRRAVEEVIEKNREAIRGSQKITEKYKGAVEYHNLAVGEKYAEKRIDPSILERRLEPLSYRRKFHVRPMNMPSAEEHTFIG